MSFPLLLTLGNIRPNVSEYVLTLRTKIQGSTVGTNRTTLIFVMHRFPQLTFNTRNMRMSIAIYTCVCVMLCVCVAFRGLGSVLKIELVTRLGRMG